MSAAAKDDAGKPVRLGVIGVGIMGSNHARVLADLGGVKVVGIADPGAAHRELLGQILSCAVCNDADALVFPGATELCNDNDDDCNGLKDDEVPGLEQECSDGARVGVCQAGKTACQGGQVVCAQGVFVDEEICDGLDAASRASLLETLDRVARGGTQLLYVTHRAEEMIPSITRWSPVAMIRSVGRSSATEPAAIVLPSPQST